MDMEFNYDHLVPLEPAARIYCAMRERDADEVIHLEHPLGLAGVTFSRPAWHFVAEEMLNLNMMLVAMRQGQKTATNGH
jgi:hypothetical protein